MSALLVSFGASVSLPLLLALYHVSVFGLFGHPPPLLVRARPTTKKGAWVFTVVGAGLCYAAVALLFLLSLTVEGVEGGRTVEPMPGSPAAVAGIRAGDQVRAVNGKPVESFDEIRLLVGDAEGSVELDVQRDEIELRIQVEKDPSGRVGLTSVSSPLPFAAAVPQALVRPALVTLHVLKALLQTLAPVERELAGPVGIVKATSEEAPKYFALAGMLLTKNLLPLLLFYALASFLDFRARAAYQATQGLAPDGDVHGSGR